MRTVGKVAYIIGATIIWSVALVLRVVRTLIMGIYHVVSK